MARDTFKGLRDSLYTSLTDHCCVPQVVDIDGSVADQLERRFFPAGTAAKVLTVSKLERLFTLVARQAGHKSPLLSNSSQLAQQAGIRKLHEFIAILIISRCDIEALVSFTEKLVATQTWTAAEHALARLPAERRDTLRAILGDQVTADIFFQEQHDFFAAIIEKHKEIKGNFRRVPYVREKLIGQGSFGKIYEVVISPNHFVDTARSMVSGEGMRLARKDFELNAADRAYEQERNVLRDIVRNAKQHNNIMKSLGSLEIGLTYSIFMPLADCDLKHYMELHPKSPSGHLQKANLVECAVGLAGAIVYLHEELESPTYERLSCFHMDLKPQNILVINDPTTGKEQWKLSDFNMSRVKMRGNITDGQMALRRTNTVNDTVFEINKLFKRRMPDAADIPTADFTINRRGTGTYLAPEACVDRHPVQAESDIWSLGCVISVVFTYLHGGQAAVESFADSRYKKGMDDRFFSFTGSSALHRISDAQINDGVTRWHKQIRLETKQAHSEEGAIFETMIKFLERQVLIIDPRRRQETTADHVRKKLIESLKAFETMSDDDDNTGGKGPGLRDKVRNLLQSGTKTHTQYGEMLPTATVVKTCTFGPNGHPLVCVTDTSLAAYSLDHVLLSGGVKDTRNFKGDLMKYGEATPRDKGRLWSPNIGVSAQYILAATDHHAFDCYLYYITQPGDHRGELRLVNQLELDLPSIAKLAISPNAQYVAFVLANANSIRRNGSLYIARLDRLQTEQKESHISSIYSSSTGPSSTQSSVIGRAIPLECPAEDVSELKFSLANGLYVVAKKRQTSNMTENVIYVYAWSMENDRRIALPSSSIMHDGKEDLLQGLFTCFAPFNEKLAFAVVSQEKRVIIGAYGHQRYIQGNALGYRLLQIVMDDDDREIIALGTREARNELQLLTFSASNTKDVLHIKRGKKLAGMTHQSKYVAAVSTVMSSSIKQRYLLLAILEGLIVRIARVDLDV